MAFGGTGYADIGPLQNPSTDLGPYQSQANTSLSVNVSDTITFSDIVSELVLPTNLIESLSDSIAITDAVAELLPLAFNLSDTLSFIDTQTIFQPDANFPSLFTDDSIYFLDSVQATVPSVGILTKSVSDSFTISDSTSGGFAGIFLVVSDTLTLYDNFNYLDATAADSFTISDQFMCAIINILLQQNDTLQI